jgi:hypothetical protein
MQNPLKTGGVFSNPPADDSPWPPSEEPYPVMESHSLPFPLFLSPSLSSLLSLLNSPPLNNLISNLPYFVPPWCDLVLSPSFGEPPVVEDRRPRTTAGVVDHGRLVGRVYPHKMTSGIPSLRVLSL